MSDNAERPGEGRVPEPPASEDEPSRPPVPGANSRPPAGRARGQRWSPSAEAGGTTGRLEAMMQAEFRVLHAELEELREMVKGGPNVSTPPPPKQQQSGRRSLGRGLDALLGQEADHWWERQTQDSTENNDSR